MTTADPGLSLETTFREEWPRAVGILTRVLGDLSLAEDAVQDAFAKALERWPRDGVPRSPGAWIVATARNGAIDRIRRERTLARKAELLARLEDVPADEDAVIQDAVREAALHGGAGGLDDVEVGEREAVVGDEDAGPAPLPAAGEDGDDGRLHLRNDLDAVRFRPIGAVTVPELPWINRPTYQQVVQVNGHRPR